MLIISHRGYWNCVSEKNTETAFRRSFKLGFGTETDIRDIGGKLVVSHDPPNGSEISFKRLLEIYKEYSLSIPLALNIKADGLQNLLKEAIEEFSIENYFVFDMSIPDALLYISKGFNSFTRQSELEKEPSFYEQAVGVWMDCFFNEWVDEVTINNHLNNGKKACLVSPELHKRDHIRFWNDLRKMSIVKSDNILLCTDFPEEAKTFFAEIP